VHERKLRGVKLGLVEKALGALTWSAID